MSKNLPCLKLVCWPIKLAVWKHKDENRAGRFWYSGSLSKTYKDKNGEYQDTDRLNGEDFIKAASLLEEAHRRLVIEDQEVKAAAKPSAGDDVPF